MKKIIIYAGILTCVGLLLKFVPPLFDKPSLYHSKISFSDVKSIDGIPFKEKQKQFINAFNEATFVRDNDDLEGTTIENNRMTTITLKSGKMIRVIGWSDMLEVVRNDNVTIGNRSFTGDVDYYIESKQIPEIVNQLQ